MENLYESLEVSCISFIMALVVNLHGDQGHVRLFLIIVAMSNLGTWLSVILFYFIMTKIDTLLENNRSTNITIRIVEPRLWCFRFFLKNEDLSIFFRVGDFTWRLKTSPISNNKMCLAVLVEFLFQNLWIFSLYNMTDPFFSLYSLIRKLAGMAASQPGHETGNFWPLDRLGGRSRSCISPLHFM